MTNLAKSKKTNSTLFITLMVSIFMLTGCAEDRPDRNEERDEDKVELSFYDGKEFDLETTTVLSKTPLVSDATNQSIDMSSASLSDRFTLVSYNTNSNLFEDVPFFALPGQKYKLRYEVTNTHLVVNKVAKPELIPFTERTFAKKEGANLVVPTVGYPITLYKKKRIKNLDDEFTNQFEYIIVQTRSEATHMRVNFNSRETFDIEKKLNVLPVDIFTGTDPNNAIQWFYSATIVGAPPELANVIGRDVTADFSQGSVSRVKFIKADNAIMGVNLNVDKVIDTSDENNLGVIIRIPVEWLDFRQAIEGENRLLREEVLGDGHKESVAAKQRPYIRADFPKVTTAASGGFDTSFANDFSLFDLEISEGYISFVTEDSTRKIRTRYSFRAAHAPKTAQIKRYYKDDRDIFGYFTTVLNKIQSSYTQERESEREKNILINHFMPEEDSNGNGKKEIRYFFSKLTTTESMRAVSRIAVDVWNKAFEQAGTNIEVILDESKDVNLGDLRYNIINVVDNKNGGNLLGYGPTIADTDTGEIIAGSSNIYADPFRQGLVRDVRNYIRARRGLFSPNYLGAIKPAGPLLGGQALDMMLEYTNKLYDGIESDPTMLTNRLLVKELKPLAEAHEAYKREQTRLNQIKERRSMNISQFLDEVIKSNAMLKSRYGLSDQDIAGYNTRGVIHYGAMNHSNNDVTGAFETASKDVIEEIESRCKPELDEYIEKLEAAGPDVIVIDEQEEEEIILACINKRGSESAKGIKVDKDNISLLESRVLSTLVHEMGHNFSLRHNFLASTDHDHYPKDEDGNVLSKSASVMDYNRGNVNELLAPAKYDIEAIRFLYGRAVTTKDNNIVRIDNSKSLLKQLGQKGVERLPLKFCTDENALWLQIDPLCARHDHGESPLEIVKENILSVNSLIAVHGYRYDKAASRSGNGLSFSIFQRNFLAIQKIYSQWRFHLASFLGNENRYLESMTEEQLQAKLDEMKNHKDSSGQPSIHSKNYKDYYEASEEAYKFLRDMAFNTSKYCMFKGSKVPGGAELYEFMKLQGEIAADTNNRTTIQSCKDEYIKEWAKAKYASNKNASDDEVDVLNPERDGVKLNGFGEYTEDVRQTLDPNSQDFTKFNIGGLDMTRRLAMMVLTLRSPTMFHLQNVDFVPNFIDRPKYKDEIGQLLLDRSINGITHNNAKYPGVSGQYQFLKYARENVHLAESMMMYRQGLAIPGEPDATRSRLGATFVQVTNDPSLIRDDFLRFEVSGGLYIATHPRVPIAGPIIQKRIQLARQQSASSSNEPLPELSPLAEVEKFITDNNLIAELPTQEEIDGDITFADFLTKVNAYLNKVKTLTSDADAKFVRTMTLVNAPYAIIVQSSPNFPPETQTQRAAEVLSNEGIVQSYQRSVPGLMQAASNSVATLFVNTNLPVIARISVNSVEELRELREDYNNNRDDRDAQLDLLTDVLLRFGGQRGTL